MTPCLQPEEFIDAIDGALPPARLAHLGECDACHRTLAEVRGALVDAHADEVPEPSPFFWPSVNARVRAAMRDGSDAAVTGWSWTRWSAVLPVAALALLVVALVSAVGRPGAGRLPALDLALDAAGDAPDVDPALSLVVDLASVLDDDADPLGLQPLPDLGDVAAATLSAEEQDALRALLQSAVERPPS